MSDRTIIAKLNARFERLIALLNGVGTVWIFFLMILINADVFRRAAINRPIEGVEEIVSFSIVGIFFLQLAHTLGDGRMTRNVILVDAIATRWPTAANLFEALLHAVGAAMFLIVFRATLPIFDRAWSSDDFYGNIGLFTFPVWPLKLLILVGSFATAIQYLALAASFLRRALDPKARSVAGRDADYDVGAYK